MPLKDLNEVSYQLLLFKSPFPPPVRDCLILAHGSHTLGQGTFAVPDGVTLHFFTDPGINLTGAPLELILDNSHLPRLDSNRPPESWTIRFSEVVDSLMRFSKAHELGITDFYMAACRQEMLSDWHRIGGP